jgi:hypothetical protein
MEVSRFPGSEAVAGDAALVAELIARESDSSSNGA